MPLWNKLQGKKTYIMAGVLFVLGVVMLLDKNAGNDAFATAFIANALALMGLHAQAERKAQMIANGIDALKHLVHEGKVPQEDQDKLVRDGAEVAGEIIGQQIAPK